jgi:hypothetical protein
LPHHSNLGSPQKVVIPGLPLSLATSIHSLPFSLLLFDKYTGKLHLNCLFACTASSNFALHPSKSVFDRSRCCVLVLPLAIDFAITIFFPRKEILLLILWTQKIHNR